MPPVYVLGRRLLTKNARFRWSSRSSVGSGAAEVSSSPGKDRPKALQAFAGPLRLVQRDHQSGLWQPGAEPTGPAAYVTNRAAPPLPAGGRMTPLSRARMDANLGFTSIRPRKPGQEANGVRHGCCVVFEALKNGETTAASPEIALRVPRPAAFDNPLSRTEFREARGASRGNACLDSNNAVSPNLRFGLQSTGFFSLVRVKPRHQNVQQDGVSSGAHSIARQLVCRTGLAGCPVFP
jgi:hypothetical protein